jgi:hypothetical protein
MAANAQRVGVAVRAKHGSVSAPKPMNRRRNYMVINLQGGARTTSRDGTIDEAEP